MPTRYLDARHTSPEMGLKEGYLNGIPQTDGTYSAGMTGRTQHEQSSVSATRPDGRVSTHNSSLIFIKPEGVLTGVEDYVRDRLPYLGLQTVWEAPLKPLTNQAVDALYGNMAGMPVFDAGHVHRQFTHAPGHLFVVESAGRINVFDRIRYALVGDSNRPGHTVRRRVLDGAARDPNSNYWDAVQTVTGVRNPWKTQDGIESYFVYNSIHSPKNAGEFGKDLDTLRKFIPASTTVRQ